MDISEKTYIKCYKLKQYPGSKPEAKPEEKEENKSQAEQDEKMEEQRKIWEEKLAKREAALAAKEEELKIKGQFII